MNKTTTLLIAGLVLTILSGILRGRIDTRWASHELQQAAVRVNSIPKTLGDWTAPELRQLDDDAARMLRCEGHTVGSFQEQGSKDLVSMVLLVGPAGPLAVHTPDVCYGSNNYTVARNRERKIIVDSEGNEHEFSVITFKENRAGNRLLRVYYAWNHAGEWVAPSSPRTSFAGIPMLYKIQIATHAIHGGEGDIDAGERFLQENLPQLETIYSARKSD